MDDMSKASDLQTKRSERIELLKTCGYSTADKLAMINEIAVYYEAMLEEIITK